MLKKLARVISQEIKQQNLTQEKLAKQAGISHVTLQKILSGENTNIKSIEKVCKRLKITLKFLKIN